jgi:hypothetical protein
MKFMMLVCVEESRFENDEAAEASDAAGTSEEAERLIRPTAA